MELVSQIRRPPILLAAFVVEVVLFALVGPARFVPNDTSIELMLVVPECNIASMVSGWWAARRAAFHHVLYGTSVGLVAALIYAALTWNVALPLTFSIANYGNTSPGLRVGRTQRAGEDRRAGD
jgi:hypothetical protein